MTALLRPTVRVRLTALYGGLFAACAAGLMAVAWWLMQGHLTRTLPAVLADAALSELAAQFALALLGATLVALALGWAMAGRVLAPLSAITATARRVSDARLDERIALRGPQDELRELADTLDAMLDRLGGAFEAQQRFVANASHELRSPLTVIRTEADVALADPGADAAELRRMGEAVLEATDRTDALLEGLLLLARSQRGLLRHDPVDLGDVARIAVRRAGGAAARAGVALRLAAEPAAVTGDPALLERLTENLVENAVAYNHADGWVGVSSRREGGRALLEVENSGPEVPPAAVGRLLEPFERGGRHRSDRGAGAGLGLSIVRSVAEAHGGELAVVPRVAGGLRVTVSLPARG